MNNKNAWTFIIAALVAVAVVWTYSRPPRASERPSPSRTFIAAATYFCDKGKIVSAEFYDTPTTTKPVPGEPPHPTESVDVSIGGAPTTTLAQTMSADGARFANADESLVFWNKGNTALIMRNNSMDLGYTNCATQPGK
ncbi:MAG TPA: MliC family protein [Candidatus Paceibacterota bacterium]|nr:MliC family protein [Candidatus Paceibacterota bacterium]